MASTGWDRALGAVLVAVAVGYIASAASIHVPFQYEPLGPKAFPILLGSLLAVCGGVLICRPDAIRWFDDRAAALRVLAGAVIFCVYAALFEPIGFIVSTILMAFAVSRLFGLDAGRSVAYGIVLALAGYFGAGELLGLNLPDGTMLGE